MKFKVKSFPSNDPDTPEDIQTFLNRFSVIDMGEIKFVNMTTYNYKISLDASVEYILVSVGYTTR